MRGPVGLVADGSTASPIWVGHTSALARVEGSSTQWGLPGGASVHATDVALDAVLTYPVANGWSWTSDWKYGSPASSFQ
jgi:hypothetical protein